jgi:hypothetical protein
VNASEVTYLIARMREDLSGLLHQSGRILYSSIETVRPGDLYLLGINPGGDPDQLDYESIAQSIAALPEKDTNSYLDEIWRVGTAPGAMPLQRRVAWLLSYLGYEPRAVCASNLIFVRSRGSGQARYPALAYPCWKVHRRIISIVQPKVILVFGQEAYDFLRNRLPSNASNGCIDYDPIPAKWGNWRCTACSRTLVGRRRLIIGLPHLSWFSIDTRPEVAGWVKRSILMAKQNSNAAGKRPTVFLIAQPTVSKNGRLPDLTPLAHYGDVRTIIEGGDYPSFRPDRAVAKIADRLQTFDPDNDFLAWAGGDTLAAVLVGAAIAKNGITTFQWLRFERARDRETGERDNFRGEYTPVRVCIGYLSDQMTLNSGKVVASDLQPTRESGSQYVCGRTTGTASPAENDVSHPGFLQANDTITTTATRSTTLDETPAIIDPPASTESAGQAGAKVVAGINYAWVMRTTGATYPFKGIRGQIMALLDNGMTVQAFVSAARTQYGGGLEDVRILLRKGIVRLYDTAGNQMMPV